MEDEFFRYDLWIEEALRQVILRALQITEVDGLPGDHHFYVTFRTNVPGVEIPPSLRAQHPNEMTIVLQHQFEDLNVDEEGFSVVLRFNGKPEKLRIPFETVTSFADPSVNFGLQLKTVDVDDNNFDELNIAPANTFDGLSKADVVEVGDAENAFEKNSNRKPETGEIITLDAFRKK